MTQPDNRFPMTHSKRLLFLSLALFAILTGVYFFSFRGVTVSNDENFLFNGTEGFVRRGDFRLTLLFDVRASSKPTLSDGSPWPAAPQEPLQEILAAPLFALAQRLPVIGLMHTGWLFNIFVTALTAVVLFLFAHRQGYSIPVAWGGALLYGIGTIAWPYSRTFFREPLTGLFLLISIISAWELQRRMSSGKTSSMTSSRKYWHLVLALLVSFVCVYLTKTSLLLLIPSILILLIPSGKFQLRENRALIKKFAIGGIGVLVVLIVLLAVLSRLGGRFSWQANLQKRFSAVEWQYVAQSVVGYEISPGRSIWLYSPILLLFIAGTVLLVKRGEWRIAAAGWLGIFIISFFYGILLRYEWWGGNGWGPRYFIPLIPLLMLGVFPALEWLVQPGRSRLWWLGAGILIAGSVAMQMLGVAVDVHRYYAALAKANIPAGIDGLWNWQWSPIPKHLELFDLTQLDFAWQSQANPAWIAGVLALAVVGVGLLLVRSTRRQGARTAWIVSGLLGIVLLSDLTIGLYSLRHDPRYTNNREDVMTLQEKLSQEVRAEDVVFLNNKDYQRTFMNYFKVPALFVTLPFESGERNSPDLPLPANFDQPAKTLNPATIYALDWSAKHYKRLWLITYFGAFVSYAVRPTERYLAENYFPLGQVEVNEFARAVSFSAVHSPSGDPANQTDLVYGEQLRLVGYDLPSGTTYHAGDILPISLVWQPLKTLPLDYNISVQLADQSGALITQRDGPFQGTFGYTSHWTPMTDYRDNHALQLPSTLAPGQYIIRVAVYNWQDGKRLSVASKDQHLPDDIALLTTVTVQ